MKKITTILIILLFATEAKTQDNGFIIFSTGPSIPVGDFSSKSPYVEAAGYAENGWNYDLSFGIKTGKYLGVIVGLKSFNFSLNYNNFCEYNKKLNNLVRFAWEADNISQIGIFSGLYGQFSLSKRFIFETKNQIGILSINLPEETYSIQSYYSFNKNHIESQQKYAFAIDFECAMRYKISRICCLLLNFSYIKSGVEFSNREFSYTNGAGGYLLTKKEIEFISLNLGLGFNL